MLSDGLNKDAEASLESDRCLISEANDESTRVGVIRASRGYERRIMRHIRRRPHVLIEKTHESIIKHDETKAISQMNCLRNCYRGTPTSISW